MSRGEREHPDGMMECGGRIWCRLAHAKRLKAMFSPSQRHVPRGNASLDSAGFSLVELLVVMAIVALLMSIAVPRYFHSTDRAREAVLKQNLLQMREAIDKFYGDRGRYPTSLEDLVNHKYLRRIPLDPITDSTATWRTMAPDVGGGMEGVFDVRSGAEGTALDGSRYQDW